MEIIRELVRLRSVSLPIAGARLSHMHTDTPIPGRATSYPRGRVQNHRISAHVGQQRACDISPRSVILFTSWFK